MFQSWFVSARSLRAAVPALRVSASLGLALLLCACGGGGGSSSSVAATVPAPVMVGGLLTFPSSVAAAFGASVYNTAVAVQLTAASGGAIISNAIVTVNGLTLTYNSSNSDYEGFLTLNAGGSVSLDVLVSGTHFTASGTQVAAGPTITAPLANSSISASAANTVSWTNGTSGSGLVNGIAVYDTSGNLVWPSSGLTTLAGTVSSYTIAANSLSVGSRLLLVGTASEVSPSGFASGSALVLTLFDAVPVTIAN